jgi:hypothetical protein
MPKNLAPKYTKGIIKTTTRIAVKEAAKNGLCIPVKQKVA